MKSVDEIVRTARAKERAGQGCCPPPELLLAQIGERGYFTVHFGEDDRLEAPFTLLLHPLPGPYDEQMFHNHDCFELTYVWRGSCRELRHGYELTLHQGDLLLNNPRAVHCMCTQCDTDVIFNLLIPQETIRSIILLSESGDTICDFFMASLHNIGTGPDCLIINASREDALDEIMERIIVEHDEKLPGYRTMLRAGLSQIFVYMARRHSDAAQTLSLNKASILVQNVIMYIARNAATVTLSELSRVFSYHEKHISRQLRKELGMSFTDCLHHQRLYNATALLAHTNLPVAQIARAVGYQNVSHFYKIFETSYGETPARWRAGRQS